MLDGHKSYKAKVHWNNNFAHTTDFYSIIHLLVTGNTFLSRKPMNKSNKVMYLLRTELTSRNCPAESTTRICLLSFCAHALTGKLARVL